MPSCSPTGCPVPYMYYSPTFSAEASMTTFTETTKLFTNKPIVYRYKALLYLKKNRQILSLSTHTLSYLKLLTIHVDTRARQREQYSARQRKKAGISAGNGTQELVTFTRDELTLA